MEEFQTIVNLSGRDAEGSIYMISESHLVIAVAVDKPNLATGKFTKSYVFEGSYDTLLAWWLSRSELGTFEVWNI